MASEEAPADGSGRSTPTWEHLVLTCSSCKALREMSTCLWSPSRAGLSLVCSPAQVGTCPDAELLREHCRWKQGCIKGWGLGALPVPMKAATGQVVQSGWVALTVHPCQKREVSLYHPALGTALLDQFTTLTAAVGSYQSKYLVGLHPARCLQKATMKQKNESFSAKQFYLPCVPLCSF